MNVAFTAARGLTLESLLKAIEQKLPDHFVPDGRLEGGLSILRVNRLGKVSMVLPTAAAASQQFHSRSIFLQARHISGAPWKNGSDAVSSLLQ